MKDAWRRIVWIGMMTAFLGACGGGDYESHGTPSTHADWLISGMSFNSTEDVALSHPAENTAASFPVVTAVTPSTLTLGEAFTLTITGTTGINGSITGAVITFDGSDKAILVNGAYSSSTGTMTLNGALDDIPNVTGENFGGRVAFIVTTAAGVRLAGPYAGWSVTLKAAE